MEFENKPLIMGILNFTPDSFSDGGEYFTPEKALGHTLMMQKSGADIIDIGCQSTRPGSERITPQEELNRLEQVLPAVSGSLTVPLSVDTFYPECARFALISGAQIINDVSGKLDPGIASLCSEYGAYYAVTHNPCGADDTAEYPNGVCEAVREFFKDCINTAKNIGFDSGRLILDPGFGFGKTPEENMLMLRNFKELRVSEAPMLAGVSRKRFLCAGSADSDYATSAANALAILGGADVIRVHNVFAAAQVRNFIKRF